MKICDRCKVGADKVKVTGCDFFANFGLTDSLLGLKEIDFSRRGMDLCAKCAGKLKKALDAAFESKDEPLT